MRVVDQYIIDIQYAEILTDMPIEDISIKGRRHKDADISDLMLALSKHPKPAKMVKTLCLNRNLLTNVKIAAELTGLKTLSLDDNQIANIKIPAELIALETLSLKNNPFTTIDLSTGLEALSLLHLEGNQLTMATKVALVTFRPGLVIHGLFGSDRPVVQLTPQILQEHFEARTPIFLSGIRSSTFKDTSFVLRKMTRDVISLAADFAGNSPQALLREDIAMLRRYFANDETNRTVLNDWLASPEMARITASIKSAQRNEIDKLLKIYSANTKEVLDKRKKPQL